MSSKDIWGNISFKALSNALKELERDELIERKEYPQIPPKVEYKLSHKGQSLIPILDALSTWGEQYGKKMWTNDTQVLP